MVSDNSSFPSSTKHLCEIPTGSSPTGSVNTGRVYINFANFDQNPAIHVGNTQNRASYYGTVMGKHMRSIEP